MKYLERCNSETLHTALATFRMTIVFNLTTLLIEPDEASKYQTALEVWTVVGFIKWFREAQPTLAFASVKLMVCFSALNLSGVRQ